MICDKIITDQNCNTIVRDEPFENGFVYIYILQLNKYNGNTISQVFVREYLEDEIKFTIAQDGFYTLCSIKLSTGEFMPYYYKKGRFYKGTELISLQELVETNPEVAGTEINYIQYFQTCKLKNCFKRLALDIINSTASDKCSFDKASREDTYKRDLVWATLKVIEILVEQDNYEEAERLLERVITCNGLCADDCVQTSKCGGCGCGGQ